MNRIAELIVKHHRPDLQTDRVRFVAHDAGLVIEHGTLDTDYTFVTRQIEYLPFVLFPEARTAYENFAWDIAELNAWLQGATDDSDALPLWAQTNEAA